MKRYSAAQARQHLAELLDAAERGEPVIIERRGVRFALGTAATKVRAKRVKPLFEVVDPALLDGQWTWESGPDGLSFLARPRGR